MADSVLACVWTVALTNTEGDEAVLLPLLHALCSVPHYGSPWWPGKAMEKVGAPGGFLAAPTYLPLFAIGYFLHEPGISSAERQHPPPLGGTGLVPDLPVGICAAASRFQLVVSRRVAVLIAGGISPLDLVLGAES